MDIQVLQYVAMGFLLRHRAGKDKITPTHDSVSSASPVEYAGEGSMSDPESSSLDEVTGRLVLYIQLPGF
jgi:hypothetical protein